MIAELYRHGARWTIHNIFNEPEIEQNAGMLNAAGMRQHYNLGKAIKHNYPFLFDRSYNHNQIYVESTPYPRTFESAQSHSMGLYDLSEGEKLVLKNKDLVEPPYEANTLQKGDIEPEWALPGGFRPIPVFSINMKMDIFFMGDFGSTCPNGYKLRKAAWDKIKDKVNKDLLPFSNS